MKEIKVSEASGRVIFARHYETPPSDGEAIFEEGERLAREAATDLDRQGTIGQGFRVGKLINHELNHARGALGIEGLDTRCQVICLDTEMREASRSGKADLVVRGSYHPGGEITSEQRRIIAAAVPDPSESDQRIIQGKPGRETGLAWRIKSLLSF